MIIQELVFPSCSFQSWSSRSWSSRSWSRSWWSRCWALRSWSFRNTWYRFHQHFMPAFFVWKCFAQLFFNYILALKKFVQRILVQKLLVQCWWNWLLDVPPLRSNVSLVSWIFVFVIVEIKKATLNSLWKQEIPSFLEFDPRQRKFLFLFSSLLFFAHILDINLSIVVYWEKAQM